MIKFTVEMRPELLGGIKRLRSELRDLASGGSSPMASRIRERVGDVDAKQNDQSFASEGVKSGPAWPSLSAAYAKQKRRVRPGRKTLQYDGNLRRSLIHVSNAGRIVRWNGNVLELGTSNPIARYHQEGTSRMPARPPVRKSAAQLSTLRLAFAREVYVRLAQVTGGPFAIACAKAAAGISVDPRR